MELKKQKEKKEKKRGHTWSYSWREKRKKEKKKHQPDINSSLIAITHATLEEKECDGVFKDTVDDQIWTTSDITNIAERAQTPQTLWHITTRAVTFSNEKNHCKITKTPLINLKITNKPM